MNPGDHYRAVYVTLWRLSERHSRRYHDHSANDNGGGLAA